MTAQRIVPPPTAFSITKQKRPRERNENHLRFIAGLKCCICGRPDVQAAHIRSESRLHGKSETGMQQKAHDKFTVPLCVAHHAEQHDAGNELTWWASKGIDPFGLALSLFAATGDDEIADGILLTHLSRQR